MKKLNIAILFGGCSSEYSISLKSAYSVISHMDKNKFIPILIGISNTGNWFYFTGNIEKIEKDTWCNPHDCTPTVLSPDRTSHKLLVLHKTGIEEIPIHVAFPVLHGKNGEDGTVQGVFNLAGIPLVGCGVLSSALCMDKYIAHRVARDAGVHVPTAFVLEKNITTDYEEVLKQAESLGYPLFVKPVKAGSSLGITKVVSHHQLLDAIKLAFNYDEQVILEENITGFEVGCAILGNENLIVGEVDEIEISDGFFDYTEKYTQKNSTIHAVARISKIQSEEVKHTAKLIYKALGCRGFARVDMFLDTTGRIVFNEVNTVPGFTDHSRFPNMLKSIGLSFEQVISKAIELAVIS